MIIKSINRKVDVDICRIENSLIYKINGCLVFIYYKVLILMY